MVRFWPNVDLHVCEESKLTTLDFGIHIACAAYHGVNVVLTWNFKRIANPVQLPVKRGLCNTRGYRLPELVSPREIME
jgi:hypothetical protein